MPRTETVQPVDTDTVQDMSLVEQDVKLVDEHNQQLRIIDKEYSDNLPYDRVRIENEARFYLAQSASAMIEAGKRFILLKEHEPRGEFTESLTRIGIAPRTARRMIQASIKFGNPKRSTLAVLDKSKLFELMTEEDEELNQLLDGGTIAGKTLDEIDRMSVRELKQSLRHHKKKSTEEAEANEKLLEQKDKKINKLDLQLSKLGQRSLLWQDRVKEVQLEVTTVGVSGLESVARLDELRDVILNEKYDTEPSEKELEAMAVVYYDMIDQLGAGIGKLMNACDQVFAGYKKDATPMIDFWNQQEEQQ